MKSKDNFSREEVKAANRRYFDLAAGVYEEVDGRRGEGLASYLDPRLKELAASGGGKSFLDLGCGTGFVAARAAAYFASPIGVDISSRIVGEARRLHPEIPFLVADGDRLPFPDGRFDAAASVALLHHLFDHEAAFREVFRVLKPGGVFYTDHDLEKRFHTVFRGPLLLYRFFRDEEKRYGKACPELTGRIYRATEVHRDGLDPRRLAGLLRAAGFREVEIACHWLGLSPVFDRIGRLFNRDGRCPRGLAPSFSLRAVK
ncbi:MAG: class I SAM-dependent methyltransferase [Candidatus Erginobacter occultus]|nr:class I SAM-dependent methyltransferase [Candidatus Erginobacter occultus]